MPLLSIASSARAADAMIRSADDMLPDHEVQPTRSGSVPVIIYFVALLCACSKLRRESTQSRETVVSGAPQTAGVDHGTVADADTAWLASKSAASLAKTFRALGLDATEQGPAVSVAGKKITVAARVNNRAKRDARNILAAEFDLLVDGTRIPALTAAAIGVDDTHEHARDTAAAEWAAQYGSPIGFAIATRVGASGHPSTTDPIVPFYAKLEIDRQVLFHGPPGLRGNAKSPAEVSSDAFVRTLAGTVVSVLQRTPAVNEYRSATVLVVVEGTGVTGGECRIDGVVSPELLQAFSKLTWPEGAPSYMFKLFFVGIPGSD